jgi:alpha-1,2-mannosyltransferase
MLKDLAKKLGVESMVEFKLNFTFDNLLISLAESAVGIHSMTDEHFGIGIIKKNSLNFIRTFSLI